MTKRKAKIKRSTKETKISLDLVLAPGTSKINTEIAFFDHMLDQVARHGGLTLKLTTKGDLDVDQHHTVEDTGITFGKALHTALADKAGIIRFGTSYAPLDEALARVVIDLSGRPGLFFRATFSRVEVGELETQLVKEFFQGFVNGALATVHIDLLEGDNAHHQVEAIFKAFGLALRTAVAIREPKGAIPSTKGEL